MLAPDQRGYGRSSQPPRAAAVDREDRFPVENIERMQEAGYLSSVVPVELGGGGAELAGFAACQKILAGACASTAPATNMHLFGVGAATESWYAGDRSGEPILTLQFFWGTAADTETGALLLFGLPRATPGLSFVDTWDTMSMRGTGSWDVVFDDVFVPAAAVQRGAAPAEEVIWSPERERPFAWFAVSVAAVYLGIARAAARLAHDRVRNRTVTGASLPMAHRPEHVFGAAEIEIALRPAEAMLRDVTGRRAAGEVLAPEDLQTLKHVAVAAADSAVDRCVRMVGGHGSSAPRRWSGTTATCGPGSSIRRHRTRRPRPSARPRSASTSARRRDGPRTEPVGGLSRGARTRSCNGRRPRSASAAPP